ncbi:hypothetical protein F5882DRAFT_457285 [Hyaloscypha sp. PMI_1271]|nr:hypothetical protein F5882DRAFT_457285 [Hyaloscypha sp. PMI_1271]
MDIKSITALLTNQESIFRTILSSASSSISGNALKSKLTQHYINLVLIARDRFPLSDLTLDDPFEFASDSPPHSSSNSKSISRKRRNRTPPIEGQMTAVPVEKGATSSRSQRWQKAGGSNLFSGSGGGTKTKNENRRSGKGVAIPIVNLLDTTDDEDADDSAGSAAEDEADDNSIFVIERKIKKTEKRGRGGKRDRNGLSREEKEMERNRGRKPGMGMSGLMVPIDSTKRGGTGALREVDEETAAGFEGGREGEGGDWEMEEGIMYGDNDDEEAVQIEGDFEGESENENEGGSPSKRRRSV